MRAASFAMKQLSYHFFGNYLIQHAIVVAAKLRELSPLLLNVDAATQQAVSSAFDKLHRHLLGDIVDMAIHQQGSHVLDLLVELSTRKELFQLADELAGDAALLMVDGRGFHVVRRVIERVVCISDSAFKSVSLIFWML